MTKTARLGLPLLVAGQAQKEITHNEALLLLDLLVASVADAPSNTPPASPTIGMAHICGLSPVGQWAGQASKLAIYTEGGWRFFSPFKGMKVVEAASGQDWHFREGSWIGGRIVANEVLIGGRKVLGQQASPIADPVGGGVVDTQAREVLSNLLDALRTHGVIAA